MAVEPLITVSGLRGIVGESLTAAVAERYVTAFLTVAPAGPIVLTRDGRANGPPLAAAIRGLLTSRGRTCLDAGVAATPTTGVLVRTHRAAGGVQLSASHNPAEYNGLKLFDAAGRVIPEPVGLRVLAAYRATQDATVADARKCAPAPAVELNDSVTAHLRLVAAICDVDRIRARRFRVVLDANHGSGSVLGGPLLAALGCEAVVLGGQPDGLFEHLPEPTEANLAHVAEQARSRRADVIFCQDPDADRLAIIDERGRYLGEEKTLALCVDHVLRSGRRGPVATNCSTSRMTEDLAARYGVPFFRSKVGEANVVDRMLEVDAVLGGEGNGGVIDPRVGPVRDSFAGMALVLDAMAARGMSVGELADELPAYKIHKATIPAATSTLDAALTELQTRLPEGRPDRLDGLRLDFPDGSWLLVRPSNTEPIVRAIAEAKSEERARQLCQHAAQAFAADAEGQGS
jgi:phosphomannomutase